MFTEMRVAFFFQRGVRRNGIFKGLPNPPAPIRLQDILEFATVRGVENAGLLHKVGTLTPGKEADIVLIRAEDINTMPIGHAFDTVVQQAHAGNVDTVLIGGQVRKWRGKLVGVNLKKLRNLVHESRQYLSTSEALRSTSSPRRPDQVSPCVSEDLCLAAVSAADGIVRLRTWLAQ